MKRLMLLAFVSLAMTASAFAARALLCKYDNMSLMWTGQTRTSPASKMEYQCKCAGDHKYWLDKADCSE